MNEQRGACRSCGAVVIWARTEQGKPMPVDADPRPDGNVALRRGRAVYVGRDEGGDEPRYVSHFATCPQSRGWRRSA